MFLIENPDKARQMGERGRKAFEQKYNWDMEKRKLLDVYNAMVSKHIFRKVDFYGD